ncbi:MAG: tetratricopeptide repeat protein [Prevotellaceae bacterium]|jgi:tetratricopeptide (TPR) repeat protein|nr:tetratricopeptide repeat protein [Prevotellaceae bacterium]
MKTLKFAFLILLTSLFHVDTNAQKYGKDSIPCLLNLQGYAPEYKNKNYDAAIPQWREAFKYCPPDASQNFYIHGVVLMNYLIDKTTDPVLKEGRIDTLMMLYERRLEYFKVKDKAGLLYRKAVDYQTYRPNKEKEIYNAFLDAIKEDKNNIDLAAVVNVMLTARSMYEKKEMDIISFTNTYTEMLEIAELQIKATPDDTVKRAIKAGIEGAFLTTDAANCENLNKVLGERFRANKNDADVVKMVVSLLSSKECTDSELYYEGVEAYNKLNPSPTASYGLARMYYSKNDKEKAEQYFKEAVESETDAESKSKYYQEFASLLLKEEKVSQTISYARQAIAAFPKNGKAYFLLGTAYATYAGSANCGDDEVSKKAIYWVAVDQLMRAKQIDPSLAAEVNKSINIYSQHFPLQADAFFLNILDGDKYQVKCGLINESTIVRTRK